MCLDLALALPSAATLGGASMPPATPAPGEGQAQQGSMVRRRRKLKAFLFTRLAKLEETTLVVIYYLIQVLKCCPHVPQFPFVRYPIVVFGR